MTQTHHPVEADQQRQSFISASRLANTAFQAVGPVSPAHSRQLGRGRGHNILRRRGPHRGKFLAGAVASIVSLVTVLALLALCRSSQRRFDSRAAARRRLSDTDDESERSNILEQCLDLEEELGRRPTAPEHADDAREAKDRLAAMLYESSAAFEGRRVHASRGLRGEVKFPPYKVPRLSEQWASPQYPQFPVGAFWPHSTEGAMGSAADTLDAGAWDPVYSELVFGGYGEQQHLSQLDEVPGLQQEASGFTTRPPGAAAGLIPSSSVGGAHRREAALTPEGWLDEPLANMYPQAPQQLAVGTGWRNRMRETVSTATIDAGYVGTSSEGAGRIGARVAGTAAGKGRAVPSVRGKAVQPHKHRTQTVAVNLDAVKGSASAPAVRATSRGGTGQAEAPDLRQHPFFRLPVVNPKDIHRTFRKEYALSMYYGRSTPMESYMTMRNLFAKASLTAEDVELLMTEAELLANYAADRLGRECRRCTANYLVLKLSSLFMAFDYLVCTIEILGSKMNTGTWWKEFTQKFRTEYLLPESARTQRGNTLHKLVNRLSSALAIYRQQRRPAVEEVVDLKRIILTNPYKGSQFANPLWQLWILDDADFFGSNDDLKSSSDGSCGYLTMRTSLALTTI
ncbi:LOW QUALITY PROTEIN: uncharacterized protein EMH_0044530 [Eimeria mitis]|uniref:Uncharacterized protein n=1 Tax=Eimeria mitis TaxID=44415 RepID=U6JZC5_9EIME|nr:LOW QUALITY PROTEIN: uncharacterized protein EMH_0044530 [Eimeria mitis]CDJ28848.1 hypothetical protein, conserved [Eimeria mitis]